MKHEFKSKFASPLRIVGYTLLGLFVAPLASLMICAIALAVMGRKIESLSIPVFGALAAALFVWFMYRLFFTGLSYVVTEDEVLFLKKGKIAKRFDYANYSFSSHVTTFKTNGISSGAIRCLRVSRDGKDTDIPCALSREDFNEFMALCENYAKRFRTE